METKEISNIKSAMNFNKIERKSTNAMGNRFDKYKVKKKQAIVNERQLVLKGFLDILNPARKAGGYPPLGGDRLGREFEGISTSDLKIFFGECKFAKNFSSTFWWKLRNPKVEQS